LSYLVVVTFDIDGGVSSDYRYVAEELDKIGLRSWLQSNSDRPVDLPSNTFAGLFNGPGTAAIRESIMRGVMAIFRSRNLHGPILVTVGENWGWSRRQA
jgi:hypothetical protein